MDKESAGDSHITNTRYVILDTNIFAKLDGEDECGKKMLTYLTNLLGQSPGWGIAISDFSTFETLNEIPYNEEEKISVILKQLPYYSIDRELLIIAAHLGCMYKQHNNQLKITEKMPEPGDKIIAATAVKYNAVIYTSNMRDYPAPFFKEILREIIYYEKKGTIICVPTYIMEPQTPLIVEHHERRIPKKVIKKPKVVSVKRKKVGKK